MIGFKTFERHARLVSKMADVNGIDLEETVMAGSLTPEEVDAAVMACTGCTQAGACEHALRADAVFETPGYCRNSALFEDLVRGL